MRHHFWLQTVTQTVYNYDIAVNTNSLMLANTLFVVTMQYVFDAFVTSIRTYGCEVCAFTKTTFVVKKATSNNAVYEELDMHCNTAKRPYRKTSVYGRFAAHIVHIFLTYILRQKAWSCRITSIFQSLYNFRYFDQLLSGVIVC